MLVTREPKTMIMDNVIAVWSKTNRWHIGLALFLLIEARILPARQRGFTCNDLALSHEFHGDTITWKHLFATVLLLPLAVMVLTERIYHRNEASKPKKLALRWYKEYIFGFLLNLIAVQGIKLVVGAPRPHFFDTCRPIEAATCQGSQWVPRFTCSVPQPWSSEVSKSFPSGHTSLAVHAGLFIAYYLYRRASKSTLVYASQAALLLTTVLCGISRMIDHRHHWWDVLGGATVALPILLYTIFRLCRNFDAPKPKEVDSDKSNLDVRSNRPLNDDKEDLRTK